MREIKFEAWNPYRNVMLKWDYIRTHKELMFDNSYKWRQYIGKKDNNEKDIYKRDIVRFTSTEGQVFIKEVKWCEINLCWNFGTMSYSKIISSGYFQGNYNLEVIGNSDENPELLNY